MALLAGCKRGAWHLQYRRLAAVGNRRPGYVAGGYGGKQWPAPAGCQRQMAKHPALWLPCNKLNAGYLLLLPSYFGWPSSVAYSAVAGWPPWLYK